MPWPPIPLGTPISEAAGQSIAVTGTGPDRQQTLVLVQFGRPRRGRLRARLGDTAVRTPMPTIVHASSAPSISLGAFVQAHLAVTPRAACRIPRIRWPWLSDPWLSLGSVATGIALLVLAPLAQSMLVVLPLAVGGLVALFAGVTATFMRKASLPPRVASPSGELLPSDVIRRIPAPAPLLLGPSPAERVDVVKAAYGALVSDIGYRIENSALFDSAVPATQRFLVALQSWDTGAQTPAQADETERAFAEARAEAERRGISHLPETAREPARRAAKAATTALRSPNQAERRNAASRAAEILNSLALYYLPIIDPAEKSLIGARRMIDPAP